MWNPFRTLSESDRSRLHRLENTVDELAGDVTLAQERLVRLDARLRARARRALDASDDVVDPEPAPAAQLINGKHSPTDKAALLARARARGFMGGRA